MTADLLDSALAAAELLGPVLPLHHPNADGRCSCRRADCAQIGKHPRTAHGLDDASTDPGVIRAWWAKWPNANIGLRTGIGCDLFDIDLADLEVGTADIEPFELAGGPVVRTGKGWHFYVKPTGLGNRTRFVAHCDWRGQGGYSILPPSRHYSGRSYSWFTPITTPLHDAPAELLRALTERDRATSAPPREPRAAQRPTEAFTGLRTWNPAGIIGKMAMAGDGTRNDTLVWCANRIGLDYYEGKATRAEIDHALDALHTVALNAGLGDVEVSRTIRSGLDKGVVGQTNQRKAG